jgi:cellulose synthase/poly-beta-1,6-N-acetylglucosamine synthase-like glycosyltransferase
MFWQIISLALIISTVGYFFYLGKFFLGLKNGNDLLSYRKPFVSVIIAARNEEVNINRILTALINQSYPTELYEVIIANDDSVDNTAEIVKNFAQKFPFITLIDVERKNKCRSPKKHALATAIKTSKGEILLLTDADCLVGRFWIEKMIANFEQADMVVGFSRTKLEDWSKSHLFQKFEHFDFLILFIAAAGAITAGKYFSCSGQNIAYTRRAFDEVGGFGEIEHIVSGDDVNLMQLFRLNKKKIRFAFSPHTFVQTLPVQNWQQLLNQRSRWASNMKWQTFLNLEFFSYLTSVFMIVLLPWIVMFRYWQLAVSIIILRIILEQILIRFGLEKFQTEKKKLNFYPVWFILQPVYFLAVAVGGMFGLFKWKK